MYDVIVNSSRSLSHLLMLMLKTDLYSAIKSEDSEALDELLVYLLTGNRIGLIMQVRRND